MRSYCPTAPKLLPPKVGDSVLVITTCVTRACTDGAPQRTTPVNERQQATAVVENGVLIIRGSRTACSRVGPHHTGRYGWREASRLPARPPERLSIRIPQRIPSGYACPVPQDRVRSSSVSTCLTLASTTIQAAPLRCLRYRLSLLRWRAGFQASAARSFSCRLPAPR